MSEMIVKTDARLQRGAWAPGQYFCRCRECGYHYFGDKRSAECADCAYSKCLPDPLPDSAKPLHFCRCQECGHDYWGDMRSTKCADCTYSNQLPDPSPDSAKPSPQPEILCTELQEVLGVKTAVEAVDRIKILKEDVIRLEQTVVRLSKMLSKS